MPLKEQIAIIDDDANLRKTLADILKHYGYEPIPYPNGQSAIAGIVHQSVGVALLDLRLEDCSGLDVLRFIKEHLPHTACIILTGHASQDSAIEAVNAGAYSYFLKPVNIEQLLVTIRRSIEKRQADLALVESERHYQALADASPVGIFRTDADGNTTYVNPRWSAISGMTSEQALGMGWFAAVHPEDRQHLEMGWQDALKTQRVSGAEYRFLRPDGTVAWVIGQAQPEFNTAGQFIGYIGTITDISQRKQVEDALTRSEAQYRLITEHIEDIVWQLDQNLHFTYVSPAVKQVLGYSPEETCQMVVTDLLDEHGIAHMRNAVQERLAQDLSGPVLPMEYRMRHKNGQWVTVEVVSSPVYDADLHLMGFVGVTRNITERIQAEEQLRLQSTALESVANAIIITDVQGNIQWSNSAFNALTGYSLKEILGKKPSILKSGIQEQGYYKNLWETILAGRVWHGELINKRKDGSLYTEEEIITPLKDSRGQITHFIGVNQDISERRQAEAAIRRHVADLEVLYQNGLKLARLVERQDVAQCIIDLIEERLHWHHAVLRLLDSESGELNVFGFSRAGLLPQQLDEERQALTSVAIKPGVGFTGWVLQKGLPVRSSDVASDPRYIETYPDMHSGLYVPILAGERTIGAISVESEQHDAFTAADERLLVTLAAQSAAAFENARLHAETVHRIKELDTLVQVSAAMRTASGRIEMLPVILEQTVAVLHANGAAIAFRSPDSTETVFDLGTGAMAGYTHLRLPPDTGITGWVLGNGELYVCQDVNTDPRFNPPVAFSQPLKAMVFAPLISQNQTIGVLLVSSPNVIEPNQVNLLRTIANIAANAIQRAALYEQTLKYAAELEQRVEERTTELRTTNAALERASRSKDEFLASMSHELRTPLTGILNLSEVLQEQIYGPLNDKQLHYMHTIEESGRHLLGLINDILDLSKIEAGQFDMQLDTVPLDDICQACLQLTRGLANKKSQPVSYSIFPHDIVLQADPRRLKQMLVNLLSNAVKFTPPGGKIGLDVIADEQAQVVHLAVWDTGIGIAQGDFSRLFRPFSQLDASLSRQHDGTGLGLAIAQRLADKHGGGISIESSPGQGSRFTIHLPWVRQQAHATLAQQDLPGTGQPAQSPPLAIQHLTFRLLLADDNEGNAEVYAEYLRQYGYQVIVAGNGQEALELLHKERPDLILMDIQMPVMDGLTAIRQLRKLEDTALARTPVIALTALAMSGDRERCLEAGANDYLGKPVGLRELLRVIQTYLK